MFIHGCTYYVLSRTIFTYYKVIISLITGRKQQLLYRSLTQTRSSWSSHWTQTYNMGSQTITVIALADSNRDEQTDVLQWNGGGVADSNRDNYADGLSIKPISPEIVVAKQQFKQTSNSHWAEEVILTCTKSCSVGEQLRLTLTEQKQLHSKVRFQVVINPTTAENVPWTRGMRTMCLKRKGMDVLFLHTTIHCILVLTHCH
jgi:hypothetical protein